VSIVVNGFDTRALCDTGACVSSVSEHFYKEKLKSVPLQPLSSLLKIECANGETLLYRGFIQVTLHAPGVPNTDNHECLLLVVPETEYSTNVISDVLN